MTEINADKEKAPEQGETKLGKPGATMLTFSGAALVSLIVGLFIAAFTKGLPTNDGFNPAGLIVIAPAIIGVIQRTTSDKPVTWYRPQAMIIGTALGLLIGYISY